MKSLLQIAIILGILCFSKSFSQDWKAKIYSYDSTLNIKYGSAVNVFGKIDTLKLDLYTPKCNNGVVNNPKPLLIWVHGGAFLAGSKDEASITYMCKEFAKRGYVTASIQYRLGFIADEKQWNCNFPNYACVFATDSAEWLRAYYRAVQDVKGAMRFLINRNKIYNIDTNNVFLAGESAGAFTALGATLLDTTAERMKETFELADVPSPHPNSYSCPYNSSQSFTGQMIKRPNLGDFDNNIEPSAINYTIKAVGNMFGAVVSDLLKLSKHNSKKPAIYSYHQPCDMVVPIDSGKVYEYLSWCMTNGYGCFAIANTPKVYGSRAISAMNTSNSYGYKIQNEFTSLKFPFSYLFGEGSCLDQVNKPCHAYDNMKVRETNLAEFFSKYVTTPSICDSSLFIENNLFTNAFTVFPNPTKNIISINSKFDNIIKVELIDLNGKVLITKEVGLASHFDLDIEKFPNASYILRITDNNYELSTFKIVKD